MASTQHYSETDSIGGCTVHGFEGSELTISDGNLYALDIVNAPNLTTLNVARLQVDKAPHLLLKNLPKLQRIILPANHPGAVIHLSSEEAPGELHIGGSVCEIDGAWPGVQFRQEVSSHRKNWESVTICSTTDAAKASKTAGLVIVTGAAPTELDHLCLDEHCDWLLTDIDGVNHLQITTTGSVAVDQMPSLRSLFSTNHQLQLSLTRTPRLRRIAGGGELVSIRQSD
ncbi:hypothetical protein, partial [Marinobacter sediminum]|uniref:hypothetical protein n=1 Tax=Marinobacter sediminum TaxID=256323 RepID=UPI0035626465